MASQSLKSARKIASEVLTQFDPNRNYAAPILNKLLLKTAEKQRATDLVFGSVRNRTALDTVIAKFSGQPVERIAARLLSILRIATFELVYSPETPEYSIVNEAVENAKAIGGKKQVGFVNAVLRQITRHITNRQVALTDANLRNTIPQAATTGCEFDPPMADLLPDPEASPSDYLSAAFSLPKWLVIDWLGEFGTELTRQICLASNRRPSIYLRPNRLRTTIQQLAEQFRQADIDLEIISDQRSHSTEPDSLIKIKSPRAIKELPGFAEGLFTVQDITASRAVRILRPQPNWTILDLCAAPGVKTTQLAELTGDSARIIATDINNQRLQKLKANTTRLGINSVSIVAYENLESDLVKFGPFDAVLLDVPCSNTGVLAKRIEVRHRIKPKAIEGLTKTQSELLGTAIRLGRLQAAGKICYATCSIQKAENGDLVRDFLLQNRSFKLESEELTLPSVVPQSVPGGSSGPHIADAGDHDGGYVAIIAKK
jgi:16S rRNA (cytosine967-C5)-methyltransferase